MELSSSVWSDVEIRTNRTNQVNQTWKQLFRWDRIFSLYTSRVSRSIRYSVKWCLIRQFARTLFQTALTLKECEVHEVMESHMWCDTYPRMLKVTNMVRECPSLVWIFLVINFRRQNVYKSGTDNSETQSMTVSFSWNDLLGPEKYLLDRRKFYATFLYAFKFQRDE